MGVRLVHNVDLNSSLLNYTCLLHLLVLRKHMNEGADLGVNYALKSVG